MIPDTEPPTPYVLVGMLDSPFVRRVAIVLELYKLPYQNLGLRTVGDAEQFAAYSPLKRAPTLLLENGQALYDSHLIVDSLDERVSPDDFLLPDSAQERLMCRQVVGIAAGLADKAVSALYEIIFHEENARNPALMTRLAGQLLDSMLWLEERAPGEEFLLGKKLCHADIMVGTALRFAGEVHPTMIPLTSAPRLRAWCERLEALSCFQKTYLPVEPPEG